MDLRYEIKKNKLLKLFKTLSYNIYNIYSKMHSTFASGYSSHVKVHIDKFLCSVEVRN